MYLFCAFHWLNILLFHALDSVVFILVGKFMICLSFTDFSFFHIFQAEYFRHLLKPVT